MKRCGKKREKRYMEMIMERCGICDGETRRKKIENYKIVCLECENWTISSQRAKREYLLKSEEIADIESYKIRNRTKSGQYITVYKRKEIEKRACEKYGVTREELDGILLEMITEKKRNERIEKNKKESRKTDKISRILKDKEFEYLRKSE